MAEKKSSHLFSFMINGLKKYNLFVKYNNMNNKNLKAYIIIKRLYCISIIVRRNNNITLDLLCLST